MWLTAARRKAVYASLALVGTLLTIAGVATEAQVAPWLTLADSALALIALVLASVHARRGDVQALYAAAAAVIVGLVGTGVITGSLGDRLTQAAAAIATALPMILAYLRTDSAQPDGSPAAEVTARRVVPRA